MPEPRFPLPYEQINKLAFLVKQQQEKTDEKFGQANFRIEQLRSDINAIGQKNRDRVSGLKAMAISAIALALIDFGLILFWKR